MAVKKNFLPDELYQYVLETTVQEPPILAKLREETAQLPNAEMQIPAEQGQLFRLFIPLLGVKKALEVGVFTGYSSLTVAQSLPADGKLIACDVSDEYTRTARRYWQEAGVTDKIDLRLGPATETLRTLLAEGHGESFDFTFVDADKGGYCDYLDLALPLVRKGGLLAFDNTLYHGTVSDAATTNENAKAIRKFNEKLASDSRVRSAMIPMADGLTLAMKL